MNDHPPRTVSLQELFRGFFTIGMLGFGGVAAIARHVIVEKYAWLSEKEYATVLGLGKILPGANTVNAAVMIGDRFQGTRGALVAVLAILCMPLVVLMLLATLYAGFSANPAVNAAVSGAAAAAAGLVIGTGLKMAWRLQPARLGWLFLGLVILAIVVFKLPLIAVVLVLAPIAVLATALARRKP